MVYDAQDNFMGDIPPAEVFERTRTEEINGANSLKLSTVHPLEVGNRLLNCDATGTWREYVVTGIEQGHTDGLAAYCTYYAVWSIQYDLTGVTCDVMPGVKSPVNARAALVALLGNTSQWAVGNVDVGTTGGASMWQRSAWEAMSTLIDVWGGEIAPRIEVDNNGVVSRLVDYRARVGATKVTRRFDYGADLADIKRKVADTVRYCRIVPLGAGSTDAVASADRKRVTIKSVNDGVEWLQNDSVVPIVRRPNGSGGWEYPTKFVIFDGVEDPQTLKDTALRALEEYTTPKVSYTAKVTQFAQAGVDLHGVAVGDAVDVVDKEFGVDGGLRLTSRIVKLVTDELQPENVTVTLGNVTTDLSSRFTKLDNKVARVSQALANQEGGTWEYLNAIVDNLNAAINATGGYTYVTEGQGIRTYDKAVSDPLVGTEASKVVEVKGGSVRIADSRTTSGDWDWRTVFVSGHIAADLVTAAQINAGYIGSPTGNYWDLDTGALKMTSDVHIGDQTLAQYIAEVAPEPDLSQDEVFNALTNDGAAQGMFIQNGQLYINATYLRTGIIKDALNKNYWNMQTGEFSLSPTTEVGDTTLDAVATNASTAITEARAEVGGTNLLLDSNRKDLAKRAATAPRYWSRKTASGVTATIQALSASARPVGGVDYAAQFAFKASQTANYGGIVFYDKQAPKMIDGQKYTVSCWAMSTAGSGEVFMQYGNTKWRASAKMAVTSKWKRYSWTFTFSQSAAGGSNGARIYFYSRPKTAAACTVQMCGFKLEIGARVTDWSPAPEDLDYDNADTLNAAKTFTNSVAKKDRDYTDAQRKALDDSLNQEKIFKRLTNNGKAKGIILKGGQLYINASYINAGTVSANVIKAGILSDKNGKTKLDLDKGTFTTNNAELKNCRVAGNLSSSVSNSDTNIEIRNGGINFGYKGKPKLKIRADYLYAQNGEHKLGTTITALNDLMVSAPRIWMNNGGVSNYKGFTGAFSLPVATFRKDKGSSWLYFNTTAPDKATLSFEFVNGLCVKCKIVGNPT